MANDHKTWLNRAKSSLAISKINPNKEIFYEDLCFQAQQAVEKAIKGLLIFYGVDPEKTHNLVSLIKELSKYIDVPEEINQTAVLSDYAVQTRYPGDYTPIDEVEYNNAVLMAEKSVQWIDIKIKELIKKVEDKKEHPFLDDIESK